MPERIDVLLEDEVERRGADEQNHRDENGPPIVHQSVVMRSDMACKKEIEERQEEKIEEKIDGVGQDGILPHARRHRLDPEKEELDGLVAEMLAGISGRGDEEGGEERNVETEID